MTRSTWCVDECDGEALLSRQDTGSAGIAPSSSFERAVEILLGRLDANGPHRLRRAEPARCRRTRARLERRIEEDARTTARVTEAGSLGRKHGRAPLKLRRFIVRSASGSARGGCGLKARGSRRTPAVPRDGPASSGNHDEDIRLRRAVPVQALRVSAGARRAIHLSRVLNIRGTPRPSQPFPHPLTEPSFTVRASWARCSRLRTRVRTRCWSHPRDPASPSRCCAQVRKPAHPVSPDRCTPLENFHNPD